MAYQKAGGKEDDNDSETDFLGERIAHQVYQRMVHLHFIDKSHISNHLQTLLDASEFSRDLCLVLSESIIPEHLCLDASKDDECEMSFTRNHFKLYVCGTTALVIVFSFVLTPSLSPSSVYFIERPTSSSPSPSPESPTPSSPPLLSFLPPSSQICYVPPSSTPPPSSGTYLEVCSEKSDEYPTTNSLSSESIANSILSKFMLLIILG